MFTTPKPLRVVIFAKAPLAGFAKTRLIPALGSQGAADLARRLLVDTFEKVASLHAAITEVCVTPFDKPLWARFNLPEQAVLSDQGDGDLGKRMARAVCTGLRQGEAVILLGTDCPECDAAYLQRMALALQSKDAVIARAADGGYPAIGLNRFDSSVFEGLPWSTSQVFEQTTARFAALGWTWQAFEPVHDIDEASDLKWLPAHWPEYRA